MKKIITLFLLPVLFVQGSCSKETILKEGVFELAFSKCAAGEISGNELSLCYTSTESDSRCPVNVVCVWEGTAICNFSFIKNGNTHLLKLATLAVHNAPKDTIVAGFKIEFLNLSPYPGTTNGEIKDKERKAELKITKM